MTDSAENRRIIVIDDELGVHRDFEKILGARPSIEQLQTLDAELFGNGQDEASNDPIGKFALDFATQGAQGLAMLERAANEEDPYAVAFVDMRMPPGMDGLQTIVRIFDEQPETEVVLCTAFSDHSLRDVLLAIDRPDQFLLVRKPFDPAAMTQIAVSLTQKWQFRRDTQAMMADILDAVGEGSSAEGDLQLLLEALKAARQVAVTSVQSDPLAMLDVSGLDPGQRELVRSAQGTVSSLVGAIDEVLGFSYSTLARWASSVAKLERGR